MERFINLTINLQIELKALTQKEYIEIKNSLINQKGDTISFQHIEHATNLSIRPIAPISLSETLHNDNRIMDSTMNFIS